MWVVLVLCLASVAAYGEFPESDEFLGEEHYKEPYEEEEYSSLRQRRSLHVVEEPNTIGNCSYGRFRRPVCGSDNVTYHNWQHLRCENEAHPQKNITVRMRYPCICEVAGTNTTVEPVCAFGWTFPNKWMFQCFGNRFNYTVTPDRNDTCDRQPFNPCRNQYYFLNYPVCGTNGMTYRNIWQMKCHAQKDKKSIELKHTGKCPCKRSLLYKPVCASDNETYANVDILKCDSQTYSPWKRDDLKVTHEGACKKDNNSVCEPRESRSRQWQSCFRQEKLCATNGITYQSRREIECLNKWGAGLGILYRGECKPSDVKLPEDPKASCEISNRIFLYSPVCGTDGITYRNVFSLHCNSLTKSDLSVLKGGKCEEEAKKEMECGRGHEDRFAGSNRSRLICGSNGITYQNWRELACAKRENEPIIFYAHGGPCTPEDSPCDNLERYGRFLSPVCASNGQTYANDMAFWCARKEKPDLRKKYWGECMFEEKSTKDDTDVNGL